MINWKWIYRDFLHAYGHCLDAGQWVTCYKKLYLEPNRDVLQSIHFEPKGFQCCDDVLEKINELGIGYFSQLRDNIGNARDFEDRIQSTSNSILSCFGEENIESDIYVIVGLDCTNIYSTLYNGKTVTVICLESVRGNFEGLNLLLSHEIHHWVREKRLRTKLFGNCVGERAVTEGLAISCSEFMFPGLNAQDYCYVPEPTVSWVYEHWEEIDHLFRSAAKNSDITSGFFTRNQTSEVIKGMPPRIGYVYGYIKVTQYMKSNLKTPVELVGVPWTEVVEG